jgi:hypothetical protein
LGSTPVSGVGESVSLSRTLKDCFGETPKPTPETGVLPGNEICDIRVIHGSIFDGAKLTE